MDPVTHFLSGPVLSKTGFSQKFGWRATLVFCVAVMLPDSDIVLTFADNPFIYLRYHRGFTHSFLGGAVLALIGSSIVYRFTRLKQFFAVFTISIIGIYLHIFLDLVTSFGTQIFWPSTERYSLFWIFIIDPWLTSILIIGVVLSWRIPNRSTFITRGCLFLLAAYIGLAGVFHEIAEAKAAKGLKDQGISFQRITAVPQPFSFFNWMGLAESSGTIYQARYSLLDPENLSFQHYSKKTVNGKRLNIESLEEVRLYRWFSDYPIIREIPQHNGDILFEYFDLKYEVIPNRHPFLLRIVIGQGGKVKSVTIH